MAKESLQQLAVKSLALNKDVKNFLDQMITVYEHQLSDYVHTDDVNVQHVARASERVITLKLVRDKLYNE